MQCSRKRGGKALLIFGLDAPLPQIRSGSDYQQQAHPFREGRRPVERIVTCPAVDHGPRSLKVSSSSTPLVAGRETVAHSCRDEYHSAAAARRIRRLEQTLLAVLARAGYDEIILPMFEYFRCLHRDSSRNFIEKCYQLVDRTTGRLTLLRPDATAQIAPMNRGGWA